MRWIAISLHAILISPFYIHLGKIEVKRRSMPGWWRRHAPLQTASPITGELCDLRFLLRNYTSILWKKLIIWLYASFAALSVAREPFTIMNPCGLP